MTSGNNDMCLTSWEKYALETTGFVSLPTKTMTWKLLPIMFGNSKNLTIQNMSLKL